MHPIYTIGHSTRPINDFIEILSHYGIDLLVDIRTMPRSRRVPDFNIETLPQSLKDIGISYLHMASLGGLRKAEKDSKNSGWRNVSFRGYADYMQTDAFKEGIEELLGYAKEHTLALMCAEAVPWRCHRSLVGDVLLVRGVEVIDIFDIKTAKQEALTPFAKVSGTAITYPPV
jgi:uncharacterized protein (DUF488 family)